MRRALQIGIAIMVVYFCFSTMRPFLAQISLEMGKRYMNKSTKMRVRKIKMGSKGSAQVTRCRLLAAYDGLYAKTNGNIISLSLSPF